MHSKSVANPKSLRGDAMELMTLPAVLQRIEGFGWLAELLLSEGFSMVSFAA
jgi:hypothetical protein